MYKIYTFIICAILFSGCKSSKTANNLTSIESYPAQTLSLQKLPIASFIGRPAQILIKDSLYLINDVVGQKALLIYNWKQQREIGRYLYVGNGPNEIILPVDFNIFGDTLAVFQRSNSTYKLFDLKRMISTDSLLASRRVEFDIRTDRAVATPEKFIASGYFDSNNTIRIYDKQGHVIMETNTFPNYLNDIDNPSLRYRLGQGHISSRDDLLLFASSFTGEINTYKIDSDTITMLNSITIDTAKPLKNQIKNLDFRVHNGTIQHAKEVCATEQYFYVLFNGTAMNDKSVSHNHILKINHAGQLVASYKIKPAARCLAVSDNDRDIHIIALSENLEYVIYKAQMP